MNGDKISGQDYRTASSESRMYNSPINKFEVDKDGKVRGSVRQGVKDHSSE